MAQPGETKTSKRRLAAAERQRQALELRKAGASFQQIATQLGYARPVSAFNAVSAGLRATLQEPADDVRRLETERLDKLLLGVWPAAIKGETQAVDRALAIMKRRAALWGLDAPAKVDLSLYVRELATALGLDPDEAVAEAQRVMHDARIAGRAAAPPLPGGPGVSGMVFPVGDGVGNRA